MSRMFSLMFIGVITTLAAPSVRADAANECASPAPIFGKVVALCGDQMIAYLGDERTRVLGIETTTSRFELAYCSTGGGRKPLTLETNSEGFVLSYEGTGTAEAYKIANMWNEFRMVGVGYNGERVNVACRSFDDRRASIEYLY